MMIQEMSPANFKSQFLEVSALTYTKFGQDCDRDIDRSSALLMSLDLSVGYFPDSIITCWTDDFWVRIGGVYIVPQLKYVMLF